MRVAQFLLFGFSVTCLAFVVAWKVIGGVLWAFSSPHEWPSLEWQAELALFTGALLISGVLRVRLFEDMQGGSSQGRGAQGFLPTTGSAYYSGESFDASPSWRRDSRSHVSFEQAIGYAVISLVVVLSIIGALVAGVVVLIAENKEQFRRSAKLGALFVGVLASTSIYFANRAAFKGPAEVVAFFCGVVLAPPALVECFF